MAYGCLGNFAGTRRRKKINQVGLTRETMFRTRDIVSGLTAAIRIFGRQTT